MKKTLTILGLVSVLTITGCAANGDRVVENPEKEFTPRTYAFEKSLPDGSTVVCVSLASGDWGGISCDWEGYHASK